jgi:acetyl esterase/lipase
MKRTFPIALLAAILAIAALPSLAQDSTRQEDVVYGRKYGMALVMDVFRPKGAPNGAGVIFVVSGGWVSSHESVNAGFANEFCKRGYTVFAVQHGCQPKFRIPEIIQDMHRAVRYIRTNAKAYGIDPERIGISGGSAGGHLSLMQGLAGEAGKADAKDPVDKDSSRVQAVGCFFPPTDFLNYGQSGRNPFAGSKPEPMYKPFRPPFDFHELNSELNQYDRITDQTNFMEILKAISPVTHVSADDPPTLIIHGDKDFLVPLQQSQLLIDKLKAAGVKTELVVKPGLGHGWPTMAQDLVTIADWFDKHLKPTAAAAK